nr:hypothetical protein [Maliibacterium massiliense]
MTKVQLVVGGYYSAKDIPPDQNAYQPVTGVDDAADSPRARAALVAEVEREFQRRSAERLPFEMQWRLNNNFLMGYQHCDIVEGVGDIVPIAPLYDWQLQNTYNHIAPIVETRLAKLGQIAPKLRVRPATSDMDDVSAAQVSTRVLDATHAKCDMPRLRRSAASWAEITGSGFIKSVWNPRGGARLALDADIYEGDIAVSVCSPFEIYPESCALPMAEQRSILHAKAYHVDDIRAIWGVPLPGRQVDVFGLKNSGIKVGGLGYLNNVQQAALSKRDNAEVVLEFYEMPSATYPQGRLIITAGGQLLHYSALPYKLGEDARRGLPFSQTLCIERPGCFFGISVIERCIPIQRAYNAVINRIHEAIARIAIGVVAAEDGSVDEEDLLYGLQPGAVLSYRAGNQPPQMLNMGSVPADMFNEAARLKQEFIAVSGVSEVSRNSSAPTGVTSGIALELLQEQDNTRLSLTAEHLRAMMLDVGKKWLRLYKQFATYKRMDRLVGDQPRAGVLLWSRNDITSDDVVFDTENELAQTPAQVRQTILQLLQLGVFNDPATGALDGHAREKILSAFHFGAMEMTGDIDAKHAERARNEAIDLVDFGREPEISELDDDDIHIKEHTAFFLSGAYSRGKARAPQVEGQLARHIQMHRRFKQTKLAAQVAQNQRVMRMGMPDAAPAPPDAPGGA